MKTLTKLDGTVVEMGRGRPKSNWVKQPDGNYVEAAVAPTVAPTATPTTDPIAPPVVFDTPTVNV